MQRNTFNPSSTPPNHDTRESNDASQRFIGAGHNISEPLQISSFAARHDFGLPLESDRTSFDSVHSYLSKSNHSIS